MKIDFIKQIIATKMVLLNNRAIKLKNFLKAIKYLRQYYFLMAKIKKK